jgi:hypothetical protein
MGEKRSNEQARPARRLSLRRTAFWIILAVLLALSTAEILYLTFFMRQWP